jgi:high-affinity Fe2+/Pb2+ permease
MSGFWWGVIIVAVLWLFFSMRSKAKAVRSFAAYDEADPWFLKNNIS